MDQPKGKRSSEEATTNSNGKWTVTDAESSGEPAPKKTSLGSPVKTSIQVNNKYMVDTFKEKFKNCWTDGLEFTTDNVKLYVQPFRICIMQKFLENESIINDLINDMLQVEWSRKQMDLYEFYQSKDLSTVKLPLLKRFYENLKYNVMPWIEKLSGIKLKHVSASCSMYNCGDYLLVHDDLLTDRQIAFVYYISPWEDMNTWSDEMGGGLEIFNTDESGYPNYPVTKRFNPKNNQLIFFKVGSKSFHQVGEVTNFDYPRLTINGWFHGDENADTSKLLPLRLPSKSCIPLDYSINLGDLINDEYLNDDVKSMIQKHIEDASEISLGAFLLPNIFDKIWLDLENFDSSLWSVKKPANGQYYEILNLQNLNGPVSTLVDLFSSKNMFQLLHEYTDLDLAGLKANDPKFTIEIQKWNKGYYTVLADGSCCSENTLDVIFYINSADNVGVMNYLSPDDDEEDDVISETSVHEQNPVLLTLTPKSNNLNIIYRSDGTTRFTKYVSKRNKIVKDVYIVVCSYME